MKAVLSNRVFMSCNAELRTSISKTLTYKIPGYKEDEPPLVIKNMARVRDDLITFPVGRIDLIPEDYEIVDKRVQIPVAFPEFKFTLRESQKVVYDAVDDNCIINAQVSWGKTFTGIAIAVKLGQKTLIIVHTNALLQQWVREVKKCLGFTPGVIGGGVFDTSTPIVIGSTRTLYNHIDKIRKAFGTIILDEMHHVSSPTFSKILDTNHARYKIGLSGTVERKDGKHVVFPDYFSSNIYKPPKENSMTPSVEVAKLPIRFLDGARTPWALRVNDLAYNEEYIHSVALMAASYAARGHSVLLVSDRTDFLQACADLIGEEAVCVIGKVKDRDKLIEQVASRRKKVLCGTQAIFSEGISVNCLSCLILGTPINNEPLLTQLIGRILRIHDDQKLNPVVVDIHLIGDTARRQASARMGLYMKEGYPIREL